VSLAIRRQAGTIFARPGPDEPEELTTSVKLMRHQTDARCPFREVMAFFLEISH
jgi:hypothetical protein